MKPFVANRSGLSGPISKAFSIIGKASLHSFEVQIEMVISIILIHVSKMPTYIILVNWTDQGIRNVKDTIKRAEAFKSAIERSEGKMLDAYYTMGQHDYVATVELPNDESAMSILIALGAGGNARTTTLKAFSLSEAEKIVSKLS